jgi:hypothetical protein
MVKAATRIAVVLVLCTIAGSLDGPAAGSSLGVEVDDPESKILEGADDEGDLTVGMRVSVKNTSESEESVELVVQGLDRDGYELFEFYLSGVVKAGQTRNLTDRDYVPENLHKSIVRWRVDQLSIRGAQAGSAAGPGSAPPGKDRRG